MPGSEWPFRATGRAGRTGSTEDKTNINLNNVGPFGYMRSFRLFIIANSVSVSAVMFQQLITM